jgi:hypothetical protein
MLGKARPRKTVERPASRYTGCPLCFYTNCSQVELTENDLKRIDEAASRLKLEGARLPEAALKMTGR